MYLQRDVVCPALIGRDVPLAAVRRVPGRAREGSGIVALIVGEAGVGKSRLLRAITEEARAAGFVALHGACFLWSIEAAWARLHRSQRRRLDSRRAFDDEAGRNGLRHDLEKLWTDHNRASDGTTRVQSEYLEVTAIVK